jgi:hypothetical protein
MSIPSESLFHHPARDVPAKAVGFREVKMISLFRPRPEAFAWWSPTDPEAVKQQGRAIFHAWK